MKFLAISFVMAAAVISCGCRHEYSPTPPPYYCQPACGCTPSCNPCAPSGTPYLQPTPNTIPARTAPYPSTTGGTYAPPAGPTYGAPSSSPVYSPAPTGGYATPSANPNPSLPAGR